MKKILLSFLSLAAVLKCTVGQRLYQNITPDGRGYNPGLSGQGNPNLVFDDVNIPSSSIAGSDSVAITNVKFALQRGPNAPAVTVRFYYSPANPNTTTPSNQISVPPVQIGSIDLSTNGGTQTDTVISIGDSIHPIFKVKTNISAINRNYATLFLGLGFTAAGANTTSWKLVTPSESYNVDRLWIYDPDNVVAYGGNFSGNPYAALYLQASGYGFMTTLPVTLATFKGEHVGSANNLSWTTASEQNNKGFEVQRSNDGITFSTISFVNSNAINGKSTSTISYQYTDASSYTGDVYYRLKQVDLDGKATLSSVVLIKGATTSALVISGIYPNPAGKFANLTLSAPVAQKVALSITDLAGRIVLQKSTSTTAGSNNLSVDVSQLSPGTYFIKVVGSNGKEASVSKFVKQ